MLLRRPHPVVLVCTILFVLLTMRLAWWQYQRGESKQILATRVRAADTHPPIPLPKELSAADWQLRYVIHGRWIKRGEILLDNRVMDDQAGYLVLAPFRLDDGRVLVIQRGWMPHHESLLVSPPLPETEVSIEIRLLPPEQHYLELGHAAPNGILWQNLDWMQYRARFDLTPVAALGQQLSNTDLLKRNWPAPDLGVMTHFGYAGQWILFGLLALGLFLKFHWNRPNERR